MYAHCRVVQAARQFKRRCAPKRSRECLARRPGVVHRVPIGELVAGMESSNAQCSGVRDSLTDLGEPSSSLECLADGHRAGTGIIIEHCGDDRVELVAEHRVAR